MIRFGLQAAIVEVNPNATLFALPEIALSNTGGVLYQAKSLSTHILMRPSMPGSCTAQHSH